LREVDGPVKEMRIQPYILAGGRSSRMGRDKAMLLLGGKTLLARSVELLQSVERLRPPTGNTVVTIAGERKELEGASRSIKDRYPGCGPLGGMEAALRDLEETDRGEWALFVPVDMPFLTPGLIDALLEEWSAAASRGVFVCYVVADTTPQPLLSLIHRSLWPFLSEALEGGRFKVTAVLESALAVIALSKGDSVGNQATLLQHLTSSRSFAAPAKGQMGESQDAEPVWDGEHIEDDQWFTNVNTPEDFLRAETFLSKQGSTK